MAKSVATAADNLKLYEKLVATIPSVERKGATMPYTSLNGHMFSFLTKEGRLALRLPTHERDAFLKKYKTKLCEQHGSVLQEYVEVPDTLLERTQELKEFFDVSYAYVGSLKPKATKKPPPKKKAAKKRNT
jgi:TfoX/Sxy family transcriptional regulator of competence genes